MAAFHRAFIVCLDRILNALGFLSLVIHSVQSAAGNLSGTAEIAEFFKNNNFLGAVFKSRNSSGKTCAASADDGYAGIDLKRCS